jgi:16S rRNA (guanine527-N7)-methyltransferase
MVSDRESLRNNLIHKPLDAAILCRGAADLGLSLDRTQVCQFRRYYRVLLEGNAKMNLTTVTEWEQVQQRHFLDSLSLSEVIAANNLESCRFVDIGSGAGLPGIPIKIAFPGTTGTLVDSTAKKVRFLRSVIETMPLPGVEAHHGRAEELAHLPDLREQFDLVVARAVAPMAVLAELTLPFCRPGGHVAVHKTASAAGEIDDARHAIDTLGGEVREIIGGERDGSDSEKLLLVVAKTGPTPASYPRRPGIPAKRPISQP